MILTDLSIGYRNHTVMSGINAQLMPGELTCLIGRNGTGKSTLMRTMAAFQPPLSGTITIPTPGASTMGSTVRSRLISVVLTDRPDVPNMTIRDMVAMGRAPYTGFFGTLTPHDNFIIDEAMRLVGLFPSPSVPAASPSIPAPVPEASASGSNPVAGGASASRSRLTPTTLFSTLSDGERQKVMIAKALAQQTPYIFLDEPTAFLDYPTKIEIMQMLQRLCHKQHKAILLSTHDLDIALRHCDRVWHMHHGTLTICQPSPTLLEII